MKNTTQGFLALMIIGLIFPYSCKKYEEGPCISLRTKNDRVTGDKIIQSYKVDGVDSSSYIYSLMGSYKEYIFTFTTHSDHDVAIPPVTVTNENGKIVNAGKWTFRDNKETLYLNLYPFITYWKIQRLTEKDLWLTTDSLNKRYELKFKKK